MAFLTHNGNLILPKFILVHQAVGYEKPFCVFLDSIFKLVKVKENSFIESH